MPPLAVLAGWAPKRPPAAGCVLPNKPPPPPTAAPD
jgi:hypothetical protein